MPRSSKRQARLSFTPLPSSSPATKGYHKQIQDRAAAVTIAGSPSKHKKSKSGRNGDRNAIPTPSVSFEHANNDGDDDDDEVVVTARPQNSQRSSLKKRSKRQERLDFSRARDPSSFDPSIGLPSSSAHVPSSSNAGVFKRARKRDASDESESSNDEQDASEPENPMSSPRLTRSSQRAAAITVDSDSDEEIVIPRPQLIEEESEDEDDEDAMPTTLGTQRKRSAQKRKRASSIDSFISSPPEAGGRAGDEDEDEDDDEEEVAAVTPRRRLKRRKQLTQQDEEDLAEDLDFLNPSSDAETSARKHRSSQSAKKTAHQKALERLKSKRSGRQAEDKDDDDNDDEDDEGSVGADQDESDGEDVTVLNELPISSRQMFAANDDDEDFIEEEDEDNPLGIPEGLPLEFSHYNTWKTRDLFQFAVEWMVHKKVNPAFRMEDGLYTLTFRRLDDEVKGLAGSKFTSAAWTLDFTIALKSRPEISYEPLDRTDPEHFMRDHCDACNRSGHPATFQVQFQGQPYHPTTLDEVLDDEEDEGEDDEDSSAENNNDTSAVPDDNKPGYDHQGREIPPAGRRFFVGKFCMANAETAHSLHHWRLHLYQIVETYLISRGYNTSQEIVRRDGMSTEKRRKYGNKILDRMKNEGEVKDLWLKFKENIDNARNAKLAGRFGGR